MLVQEYEDGASPKSIVEAYSTLDLADVHGAIAYYLRHRDEVSEYLRRRGAEHVVVVAARMDDAALLAAAEVGASGVLRRSQVTPQSLLACIRAAAAGDGSLPPDLLGRLLGQVGRLQRQVLAPRGLTFSGLTDREVKVLQLLAEGLDTAEVGRRLFLSERTVKNVVHDVTSRLNLRNRTHAVAYALREGLI